MRRTAVTLAMTLAPALAIAQAPTPTKVARADSAVSAPRPQVAAAESTTAANAGPPSPTTLSARGRANVEATLERARAELVPDQPIRDRVAEGEAKGASEEQILIAAAMLEARLASSRQALVRGGHARPSDAEMELGAQAEEAGCTSAQLEILARKVPARSAAVAFDALAKLARRGLPIGDALAQVEAKLDAGASDEALASLGAVAAADSGAVTGAIGRKP